MQSLPQSLRVWFDSPLGQYLLAQEKEYIDLVVSDIFGFNALQLGLGEKDFLQASRISLRCHVGTDGAVDLKSNYGALPIASASIDLAVLPHALEFAKNPHQILREVERILMPEGQIIICCFNPWSLWGLRQLFSSRSNAPWSGEFINLHRLKDWLALLGFEIKCGKMRCYVPPFSRVNWVSRFKVLEKIGDRWWPFSGAVYILQGVKRVHGMRLITPGWTNSGVKKKNLAAVPQKVIDKRAGNLNE